ncbi:cellulose binding domain-containing protein [Actinoplanes sp. NPDC049668]|uniref:cellulose binding domain-containing protein n=1 Tax=unclassified Actinoplanes TaxID=2626549 RepID=UPI0033A842F4
MRRPNIALSVAAAVAVTAGAGVVTALPASAAAGCRVAYTVSSTWPGGFGANVTITNLGDALTSWSLVWSYSAGQTVTQAWNTALTQSGSTVTARNAGYNGSVGTNGTVSFGFNGSWTGSNPVPTAFTLNGTACTGTTTPTTGPTTTPTTPPTTAPTTPPPTGGVPSDAVWVGSGQWDNWTTNGYTIYNNIWGSGAGTQTTWARSPSNWGVVANHPRTSGIKSYPNVSYTLNRTLSSLSSLNSSYNVTVPASGDYVTAYDIWANNNAYEIMIWANKQGAVGPIAEQYDQNGAVPTAANVSVGGATWNIYRGSNGANAVFSFVRTSNSNSGTLNVLAMLNWLRTNGWWGDVTLGQFQLGYEISGTAGQSSFTTNSYSLSFG